MQEQLISFETAKLAKEKGYNIISEEFYSEDKGLFKCHNRYIKYEQGIKWNYNFHCIKNNFEIEKCIFIPTQSLLQKWLREQKVLIDVRIVDDWNHWNVIILMEDAISPFFIAYQDHSNEFQTYEEALEFGLLEALKLI